MHGQACLSSALCITMECMKKDTQVVIRMPSPLRDALKSLADAEKRSLASYVTLVLEQHVENAHAPKRERRK